MKQRRHLHLILLLATGVLITGCGSPDSSESNSKEGLATLAKAIDDARLLNADDTPGDWLLHGRNYQENRYSPLDQINKSTVDQLGLIWSVPLGIPRGIEATPIVVDGFMYVSGPWSLVYAIDTRKGEIIWMHDPEVPRDYGERACCDVVNRGVALYKGLVYIGTFDGRLQALDAATGKLVWEVLTVDQDKPYTITGAPRVFDGKIIIGNGGAEYGVRGYVTTYDAMTGEELWRFYTVPGNPKEGFENVAMETAAETWTGEWWTMGGGGTCWDALVYDHELDLLYIGVGNGSPWNREFRSPGGGDNLYLSSIVALKPDTGEYVWHYQTTPGDTWDYTATQPIILADLKIEGVNRKVLMQAPKNGFFYVLDRKTGELISAEPFAYVNWATEVDLETGRPVETPFARYTDVNARIAPYHGGAHNWHPMAFNPVTGLVYIPAKEHSVFRGRTDDFVYNPDPRAFNMGASPKNDLPFLDDENAQERYGKLLAWDPVKQSEAWSVRYETTASSGVLATSDLVFQGTAEGLLIAYDAETGESLWSFALETGIIAPPITYLVDGVQYLSIAVGWGGVYGIYQTPQTRQINPGTVYTFALGGTAKLPHFPTQIKRKLIDIEPTATPEEIASGGALYAQYCTRCHAGGMIPDPKTASPEIFQLFHSIVGDGAFLGKGMPNFGDRLSDQEIDNIKQFILAMAYKQRAAESAGKPPSNQ